MTRADGGEAAPLAAYMIRPADRAEWIPIHLERLAEVLAPAGWNAVPVEGQGDLCLRIGGAELSFTSEQIGWVLWFEGDIATLDTDAVTQQVTDQIGAFAGEATEWVRTS